MNDMRSVIVPKSDQLNSDDLIGGPITITITEVSIRPGTEQPVSINFDGDGGKPYKPCKSMARVMVQCWGPDASKYTGRSMTLYRDPTVKWGGMDVGGIRISHMTDIQGAQTMALTATKGSRKPFTVKPLAQTQQKKAAASVADWIAGTLTGQVEACDSTDALVKVQQSKAYQAAIERGTNDDRAAMKTLVDGALSRIGATCVATEDVAEDDDTFPGDRP